MEVYEKNNLSFVFSIKVKDGNSIKRTIMHTWTAYRTIIVTQLEFYRVVKFLTELL